VATDRTVRAYELRRAMAECLGAANGLDRIREILGNEIEELENELNAYGKTGLGGTGGSPGGPGGPAEAACEEPGGG
jgi:hypothetical protein